MAKTSYLLCAEYGRLYSLLHLNNGNQFHSTVVSVINFHAPASLKIFSHGLFFYAARDQMF